MEGPPRKLVIELRRRVTVDADLEPIPEPPPQQQQQQQAQPVMPLQEEVGVSTLLGVASLDLGALGLTPAALDTVIEKSPLWFPVQATGAFPYNPQCAQMYR